MLSGKLGPLCCIPLLLETIKLLFNVVVPDTFKLLYIRVLFDVFTTRPAAPPPDCNNKLFIHLKIVSPVEADYEKLPGVDATP